MKALVTGATGFIGGALAAGLVEAGWSVNVLVRASSRQRLANAQRFHLVEADLGEETADLRPALEGCDVVFDAAAIRDRWGTSREGYRRTNAEGTRRLLQAACGRARRFVYVSSVGVLGFPGVQGIDESFPVATHSTKVDYHSTKAEAEQVVLAHGERLETLVVRPTITYGPGDADGMLTRLIDLIARGRFVRVGHGGNHFHLTYIDDLVRGLILAGTHESAPGKTFILAGPASIAVREMIGLIDRALGLPPHRFYLPETPARALAWGVECLYRAGSALGVPSLKGSPPITRDKIDILCRHRGFSSARAAGVLGYSPRVSYPEGLARTLAWMTETGRLPGALLGRPTDTNLQYAFPGRPGT
ncbi:MAG: NAD-dependent epimerase/dehydratase family protein [Planctomycetes bacterium]|nr:NAD-dependent epimerase/dehydratase family protein [Planctomycetota bacterium]